MLGINYIYNLYIMEDHTVQLGDVMVLPVKFARNVFLIGKNHSK